MCDLKVKNFAWLSSVAAVVGAAAGGAIDAVATIATSGQVDPHSLGKSAVIGAIVGVSGYLKRSPREKLEKKGE